MKGLGDSGCRRPRAPGAGRHLLAIDRVAANWQVDTAPGLDYTPYERHVLLLNLAIVKLSGQFGMCAVVFRNYHQSGSAPVQPVHDTRSQRSANAAQIGDLVQQRVDERALRMPS